MITDQEKDAALTVLADYIAQNDISVVGGLFENEVTGEFVVTYGRESALQKLAQDKAELVELLEESIDIVDELNVGYNEDIKASKYISKAKVTLEKHK